MARHDDQVELLFPLDRSKVTENPFDVRPPTCLSEHPVSGVESAQAPYMTCFPSLVQQGTRPAASVEHGLRRHHQRQVETEVAPSL